MKVIIIGCTHAGISAMRQCLKYYPEADITVYERHADISYLSCATYLHIGGTVKDLKDTLSTDPTEFIDQGVNMRMQYDVIEVNAKDHTIFVQNLQTKELLNDHYDKLIIATGSRTTIPVIPGIENPKVMLCKTYAQADRLYKSAQDCKQIAILGGGYAGVELAEGFIKSGHEVTLFQKNSRLLNEYMDENMSQQIGKLLRSNGVNVITDSKVTRFEDTSDNRIEVTTSDNKYQFDMVAICPGVLPQSDLLKGQVKLSDNGAIITNSYMETSDPDIFAAGDVTEVHHNLMSKSQYIPLASHAIRQGTLAGMNLFQHRLKSMGTQATAGMLIFGKTVACSGLTYSAAKKANFDAHHIYYQGNYRPDFMPTNEKINIELIYDRKSRRVLGIQLMSSYEVAQSANTVSVLIQNKNTIDEMAYVDMLFSPNFDEPFNYLNLVAQAAVDKEFDYQNQK